MANRWYRVYVENIITGEVAGVLFDAGVDELNILNHKDPVHAENHVADRSKEEVLKIQFRLLGWRRSQALSATIHQQP